MRKGDLKYPFAVSAAVAAIYYFSDPNPQSYYDYTFRVAGQILHGSLGLSEQPPLWLNEFVPLEGSYYSVFPFGAVLTMIPFALLKAIGAISDMPGTFIAALSAGAIGWFLISIAQKYDLAASRIVLMAFGILFGTWMWTNLTFAGAWQLALGFAMIGELGAIYFTTVRTRPLIAGVFFALAFGNRTEVLLTAPIFLYLLARRSTPFDQVGPPANATVPASAFSAKLLAKLTYFCTVPFALGVATLVYNYLRFHSFTDFGYARIPGVLEEPWYDHGIFSLYYIPRQAWEMLWKPWLFRDTFPYIVPDGFSASILWSSPFLFLTFRVGTRDRVLKYLSWAAVGILSLVLWTHGNSGGWQFGYRYAMVCLPWLFLILCESSPNKITYPDIVLYGSSFLANIYATWLFHWTAYLKP